MLALVALGLGVLSHVTYFVHGEHHVYGILYLRMLVLFLALVTLLLWRIQHQSFAPSFVTALAVEAQFIIGLFSSIVAYRVLPIHRLHKYPGPLSWRLSKLAHAWSNGDFENFRNLHAAHEEYGDYVRTGPSELSIIDPDAVSAVFGPSSKCTRAAWYGMAHPIRAIFHTRSKFEHEKRRQVWAPGLSTQALKAYQPRIESNIAGLVQQIERHGARREVVNASRWFNYLSFDVMGDIGFGKSFGMLDKGEKLEVLKKLEDGQKGLGVFGVVPWLFMVLTKIPWIRKEHDVFVEWCAEQILDRRERKTEVFDIASALIEHDGAAASSEVSRQWLTGDSRILIVAGSDAVASSLVFAFYYLAQDPRHTDAIRSELANVDAESGWDASALQTQAPYLNAFIAEVLRLWPANPSGVLRQTPKEGLMINDRFVPGDVTVCTPFWALHRSPRCFAQPLDFVPERWSTRPDLILRREAYVPFGSGAYACIGKQLALMELRLTIASLVTKFDVSFAPGEDGRALMEESKDWFTWGCADLRLVFGRRRQS